MMGLDEIKKANEDPLAWSGQREPQHHFVPIKDPHSKSGYWDEYYDEYIEGEWVGSRRIR